MKAEEWRELAECRDEDPELWYPSKGEFERRQIAIGICKRCPVRTECLQAALSTPRDQDHGIWGGLSTNQRQWLRRSTAAQRDVCASEGPRRRLRALASLGWTLQDVRAEIARQTGQEVTFNQLWSVRSGGAIFVKRELADSIARTYRSLSGRTSDRAHASNARRTALKARWSSPDDWAGIDIDDPQARPRSAATEAA